jgi:8-oxo-dGTP pyrophosphatase MutT (NUDIX family)
MPAQHPVQRAILETLRRTTVGLRYRDMRPPDIENDLYNYHLRYLTRQGLVEKRAGTYRLNETGKKHLVELNPYHESNRFKMAALCLVINDDGHVLYQERIRQPFAGQKGLVGGGIMRGEPATAAAKRRLQEEAGLDADFKLFGLIRKIRFDSTGELYTDILFHVCTAHNPTGRLVEQNEFGKQFWLPIAQAASLEREQVMGSKQFADILDKLGSVYAKPTPAFYIEETYHHDII